MELRYAENTGIAFSMFTQTPLLLTGLISLINIGLILHITYEKQYNLSFCLIISGAISNLLDRFLVGYVTDMINFTFINFAVFNLADVFINIGVYALVWNMVFRKSNLFYFK